MMQQLSGGAGTGATLAGYYDRAAAARNAVNGFDVVSLAAHEKEESPIEKLIHLNERYNFKNSHDNHNNSVNEENVNSAMRAAVTSIMTARNGSAAFPYGFSATHAASGIINGSENNDELHDRQQQQQHQHNDLQQYQQQQLPFPVVSDFTFDALDGGFYGGFGGDASTAAAAAAAAASFFDPTAAQLMFPYSSSTAKLGLTRPLNSVSNSDQNDTDLSAQQQQQQLQSQANNNDVPSALLPSLAFSSTASTSPATSTGLASAWPCYSLTKPVFWYPNVSSTAALLNGYGSALAPQAAFAAAAAAAAATSSSSSVSPTSATIAALVAVPSETSCASSDNMRNNAADNGCNNSLYGSPYLTASQLSFSNFLPTASLPIGQMPPFATAAAAAAAASVDGNNNASSAARNTTADNETSLGLGLPVNFSSNSFPCFALPSPSSINYLTPHQMSQHSVESLLQSQQQSQQQHSAHNNSASIAVTRQLSKKLRASRSNKIACSTRRIGFDAPTSGALRDDNVKSVDKMSGMTKVPPMSVSPSSAATIAAAAAVATMSPPISGGVSLRVDCECPNCQNIRRQGLPFDKTKEKHSCHIPGCHKIYKKSSHLKAHMRWHCPDRPSAAKRSNVKRSDGTTISQTEMCDGTPATSIAAVTF